MSDDRIVGRPTVRRIKPAGIAKKGRYAAKDVVVYGKTTYDVRTALAALDAAAAAHPSHVSKATAVTVTSAGAAAKGSGRSREDNLKIAAAAKDLLADLRAKHDSLPDGI